jgi:hypothetical protein
VKAETLSDGQLSPPFQLPQPLGAVAGLSLGIDVGTIGGGILGETDPLPITTIVDEEVVWLVVDDFELVEILEVLELLMLVDEI